MIKIKDLVEGEEYLLERTHDSDFFITIDGKQETFKKGNNVFAKRKSGKMVSGDFKNDLRLPSRDVISTKKAYDDKYNTRLPESVFNIGDHVVYMGDSSKEVGDVGEVTSIAIADNDRFMIKWTGKKGVRENSTEHKGCLKYIDLAKYELKVGDTVMTTTSGCPGDQYKTRNNYSNKPKGSVYTIGEVVRLGSDSIRYRSTSGNNDGVKACELQLVKIGKFEVEPTPSGAANNTTMPAGIATFTKSFITKPTIKMTKTDTNVRQLLRDRYFKKEGDKVLTAIETAEDILTGRNAIQKMLMEMVETIADTKKTIERQVGNIEDAVHDNDKQFVIKSFNILKSLETQMKAKEIVAFVDGVEVLNAIHINMNKAVEKKSA